MMASQALPEHKEIKDVDNLIQRFEQLGYVTDRALATAVYLVTKLQKPLLIEGHAGVGKTELAKVLAAMLGTRLIRRLRMELSKAVAGHQNRRKNGSNCRREGKTYF